MRFRLRIDGGGSPSGPVWKPRELLDVLRRIERDQEAYRKQKIESGEWKQSVPYGTFPSWVQCQKIAWDHRIDALLIRMNLAAVKAARKMILGKLDFSLERQLAEELPWGYSPRDWAEEILRDFSFSRRSKSSVGSLLSRAEGVLREIFVEYRDRINRDALWLYHSYERTAQKGIEKRNQAAWELWMGMGFPKSNRH